jgi:hypothetical protein
MKIDYDKKTKCMKVTMDNGVDTIKVTGSKKLLGKVRIVGTQNLPEGEDFIIGISLLYYSKRAEFEE